MVGLFCQTPAFTQSPQEVQGSQDIYFAGACALMALRLSLALLSLGNLDRFWRFHPLVREIRYQSNEL